MKELHTKRGVMAFLLVLASWLMPLAMTAKTTVKHGTGGYLISQEFTDDGTMCRIMMKVFNYNGNNAHFAGDINMYVDDTFAIKLNDLWSHFSQGSSEGKEDWFNTKNSIDKIDGYHPNGDTEHGFGLHYFTASCGGYCYLDNLQNNVDFSNSSWPDNGDNGIKKWSTIMLYVRLNSYYAHKIKINGTWFDDCQNYTNTKTSTFEWTFTVKGCRRPKDLKVEQDGKKFNLTWDYEANSENEGLEAGTYRVYRDLEEIATVYMYNGSYTDDSNTLTCGKEYSYKVTFLPISLKKDRTYNASNTVNITRNHYYNSTTTTKDATCTGQGAFKFKCAYCGGESEEKYLDALGHKYEEGDYTKSYCTRCKHGIIHYTSASDSKLTFEQLGGLKGTDGSEAKLLNHTYDSKNKGMLEFDKAIGTIGDNAFNATNGYSTRLTKMTDITIPRTVTTIGDNAFSGCTSITGTLTLPSSVSAIGYAAFSGCKFKIKMRSMPNVKTGTFDGLSTNRTIYLDDESDICTSSNSTTYRVDMATYTRTIAAESNWGTLILPFDIESSNAVQLYELRSVSSGEMTFSPVETVAANTPCLFKKLLEGYNEVTFTATSSTMTLPANSEYTKETTAQGWSIKGGYTDKTSLTGKYFIAQNKFWYASSPIKVNRFRAWFEGTANSSNVKAFSIMVDDEATPIGIITSESIQMKADGDGKHLENGHLVIRKNGVKYDARGQRLK